MEVMLEYYLDCFVSTEVGFWCFGDGLGGFH